jgi:hypothetical protein
MSHDIFFEKELWRIPTTILKYQGMADAVPVFDHLARDRPQRQVQPTAPTHRAAR